ncbi:hypothetical protein S40285_07054 [Stachybotrys chlorohalonatus IBT 40285]|uniref:Metallo-beta-lactamase domain-containing protein n=1 Tax=Stachybotrys chlorohalonatus (strain IBT 40285) TaxID=1283841 RepID=A0A084QX67_STAC4|nr:hypothetical protein S40285_07054 [Stachybotrys chlorohalonata IBT 40285]
MAPSISTSIFTAFLLAGWTALASFESSPQYRGISQSNRSASALIDSAIEALGGREALTSLESALSHYFIFIRPEMSPRGMSLVLQSGADGFACLVNGSYNVLLPAEEGGDYLDSMTEYLLPQALKLSPKLLRHIETHSSVATTVTLRKTLCPAIHDHVTDIMVVLDPENHLPLLIRTFENHRILGPTTRDSQLFNYKEGGQYRGTIGNAIATQPAADLPGLHYLRFSDSPSLAHLILEFEDSVLVFEAPPHQTDLVIQWVEDNLHRPISHLWVSHHHHDHNLDVAKYVNIGASIIVPEVATSYWSQIPNINLITFTEEKPYVHSESRMQARFLWQPHTPHSVDWSYPMVTSACPDASSSMLGLTADSFNPTIALDSNIANSWLLQAIGDGLSRNAFVIPAHGTPHPLSTVFILLGSPYPFFNSTSFVRGGKICLK